MKNLHVLASPNPSRLYTNMQGVLSKDELKMRLKNQNIYITNDEEIKEGGYVFWEGKIYKYRDFMKMRTPVYTDYFSIILTTDQDLINDGVQAIDDEFLEWFVKNPTCEKVKVENEQYTQNYHKDIWYNRHKLIIPKEELERGITITHVGKQETLEEAAERVLANNIDGLKDALQDDDLFFFYKGVIQCYGEAMAKWQEKRSYSEEEVFILLAKMADTIFRVPERFTNSREWFEQFKKK